LSRLVSYGLFTDKEAKDYIVNKNSELFDNVTNPLEKKEIIN
jgi:hypothetical protein